MRRERLKAPKLQTSPNNSNQIHDRQATELPIGAISVPALVEDPYDRQNQSVVTINLRDDPLGWMFHHKQIDTAQYRAGRKFQALYEASEIGNLKLTLKEAVDGGGITPDIVTEYGVDCRKKLMELATLLKHGYYLLCDVLGRGMYLLQAAGARGIQSDWGIKQLGKKFRECLELLAREFGYA